MWGGDTSRNSNRKGIQRNDIILREGKKGCELVSIYEWFVERCKHVTVYANKKQPQIKKLPCILYVHFLYVSSIGYESLSLRTHEKESSTILIRYFSTSHTRLCAGAGEQSRGPGEDSLQYFSKKEMI